MTPALCLSTSFHCPNLTHSSHINSTLNTTTKTLKIHFRLQKMMAATTTAEARTTNGDGALSKRAQKKLLKQEKWQAKKAQKKAMVKEQKRKEGERKRKEWEEKVAALSGEEREKLIGSRRGAKKERVEKQVEERVNKVKRLTEAKTNGQNIVVDLEFSDLMTPSEINSLVQQVTRPALLNKYRKSLLLIHHGSLAGSGLATIIICMLLGKGIRLPPRLRFSRPWNRWVASQSTPPERIMYCYAVNGRCSSPGHLWLTGCHGEMEIQLQRLPGFDKWIIEKENRPYVEAFQDRKEHLVYLTADSENILEELDLTKIYIVGGLVDRNRWKGITMKKAEEQGIQTAKLPIGSYLKMSGSKVLTVNQVIEILLKFLETRDWKASFFKVIPQRKICEADSEKQKVDSDTEDNEETADQLTRKKKCVESCSHG